MTMDNMYIYMCVVSCKKSKVDMYSNGLVLEIVCVYVYVVSRCRTCVCSAHAQYTRTCTCMYMCVYVCLHHTPLTSR